MQEQIFRTLLLTEQLYGIGLLYEINLNDIFKAFFTCFSYSIRLADLSCACYQQGMSVVEYKVTY